MLAIQYAMMAMYYAALTMQCAIVTVDDAALDRMTRRWTVYDAPAMPLKKADFGPYNMRCRTIQYAMPDHVLCPQTPLAARQKAIQTLKKPLKNDFFILCARDHSITREPARLDGSSTSDRFRGQGQGW